MKKTFLDRSYRLTSFFRFLISVPAAQAEEATYKLVPSGTERASGILKNASPDGRTST